MLSGINEASVVDEASAATRDVVGVAPWLLQPLVENAVVHGVAPRTAGGTIWISVRPEGDSVRLSVEDDGVGLGESPRVGTKKTIASLPERLALAYGNDASFSLTRREAGGARATMLIPRRTG